MKKRWLRIFSMVLFGSILMIQAGRDEKLNGNIQEEAAGPEGENLVGETEETEQECALEGYQVFDSNLLGSEFLSQAIVDRAAEDIGKEKEEFVPVVCENSSFPEGLVVKIEEVLHRIKDPLSRAYCAIEIKMEEEVFQRIKGDSVYDAMVEEFGLKDYELTDKEELDRLFPKAAPVYYGQETYKDVYQWISRYYDIPEDVASIYRMELMHGKDNYLFVSYGIGFQKSRIRLTERIGDEFRTIYEFDIADENFLTGVTRYEDKFYFIAENEDANVVGESGITIYRLGYDSFGDSIRIRYQPEEYAVESYDSDSEELQPLIEGGYIDKVLQDFSSGKYLHEGNRQDGAEIYYGDEERVFERESEGSAYEMYRMDIANCGCPVYLCKDMYLPQEDGGGIKYLDVDYFYLDNEKNYFRKLEKLSIPIWAYGEVGFLVQIWFKEMAGKVYTFRVYNLSNYNYLMNIALVEGDKVTSVGTYFLWPKKQFVLEERQVFYQEENVVQGDRYFKVTYGGDSRYHYILYGRDGNVLKEGEGKKQPLIAYIDEATIVLKEYGEEGERYTVYYDIENDRLSETYLNPVAAGEGKTAYLDYRGDDTVIVVKNMFDMDYYEEIPLDFDIENVEFSSAGYITYDTLHVEYIYIETRGQMSQEFDLEVDE